MTNATTLHELRARVLGATKGDREIDARIHHALFPDQRVLLDAGSIRPPRREPIYGALRDFPIDGWTDWDGIAITLEAAPCTTSIDAAVALAERVLPGWRWRVHSEGYATVEEIGVAGHLGEAYGATPALALTAAILAALRRGPFPMTTHTSAAETAGLVDDDDLLRSVGLLFFDAMSVRCEPRSYARRCIQLVQERIAALHAPAPTAVSVDPAIVEVEWQTLLDKDDRTSPAEYPDMCLIRRQELSDAMLAAFQAAAPRPSSPTTPEPPVWRHDFNAYVPVQRSVRSEADEAAAKIRDALWQLLDDMGESGVSVCIAAKKQAIEAYNATRKEDDDVFQPHVDLDTARGKS